MKLNCKPGDLAVIVSAKDARNIGKIIEVLELLDFSFGPAWTFKGGVPDAERRMVMDYCLRPIRDPGGDAVDETLTWLPVPELERA